MAHGIAGDEEGTHGGVALGILVPLLGDCAASAGAFQERFVWFCFVSRFLLGQRNAGNLKMLEERLATLVRWSL